MKNNLRRKYVLLVSFILMITFTGCPIIQITTDEDSQSDGEGNEYIEYSQDDYQDKSQDNNNQDSNQDSNPDNDNKAPELKYSTFFKHGVNGVAGMDGAFSVTISPDRRNVYAAGSASHSLVVFDRDTTTGALTFSKTFTDGVGGVDGLNTALSVAVSPDNKNVYVIGAGNDENAVAIFTRNTSTGELSYSGVIKNGDTSGGQTLTGFEWPYSIVVSPNNDNVYIVGNKNKNLFVFDRDATNNGALTFSQVFTDGTNGVDGLDGAYFVTASPDGQNIYVAGQGNAGGIATFTRNTSNGQLTFLNAIKNGDNVNGLIISGINQARSIAISPDNKHVYVTGFNTDTLAAFNRDTNNNGALTFSTVYSNNIGGVTNLNGAHSTAVSPNGKYVYVTSYFDNSLVVFERNLNTGALDFSKFFQNGTDGIDGIRAPFSVAVDPDSNNAYVIGYSDDAIAVFTME